MDDIPRLTEESPASAAKVRKPIDIDELILSGNVSRMDRILTTRPEISGHDYKRIADAIRANTVVKEEDKILPVYHPMPIEKASRSELIRKRLKAVVARLKPW